MMVSKDILTSLDEIIAKDPAATELMSDVDPALINAFKVRGKLYEIPTGFNDMVIHYNPKMFKEAGVPEPTGDWTWADFLDAAKKLTKGEGENKVYGFAIPAFHFGLIPWFLTNGTNTLTDDWSASNLNDPKVAESMQFVHDLVYVDKVSPMPEANVDPAKLFESGRAAMTGFGFWTVPDYHNNNFEDFAIAKWPTNGTSSTVFGVGGVGITKSCKNKALAWELVKEYSSKETIKYNVQFGTAVPARKSIAATDAFMKKATNANLFYDILPSTKPVPAPANFSEMEGIFMRHFTDLMADKVTAQEAMNAAHEELSAAMKKLAK
jgi:multiple sugar transport system substrate-binding protein